MSGLTVAIIGASGGIGSALVSELQMRDDVAVIHATRRRAATAASTVSADAMKTPAGDADPQATASATEAGAGARAALVWHTLDVTDEAAIRGWLDEVGSLDWLVNCVGMLHEGESGPEKTVRHVDARHFQRSMQINCLPSLLLGKHALPALRASSAGVFATISARVGSIDDNRLGGWYSYRCSKAALNMALKCLAIEWSRTAKNLRVAALHPGTTDTPLSEPFQANVPPGKLFSPRKTARYLLQQIARLHEHPSGRFIAYDGEEIRW